MEKPAGKLVFSAGNEILLPFLAVGIIVLGGFGVISFYNGYTIEKRGLESTARQVFSVMNQDLDFWQNMFRRRKSARNTGKISRNI